MKLRSKRGSAIYTVKTETEKWTVDPIDYLTKKQRRKMSCIPDMLLQFAHFLEDDWQRQGYAPTSVSVKANCALNSRPYQMMVDPSLNLMEVDRRQLSSEWIMPLTTKQPSRFLSQILPD